MELYHVLNRGVDKRAIFLDDHDRSRFVADVYAMNDKRRVENFNYHLSKTIATRSIDVRRRYIDMRGANHPIVQIHGWCLMGNHYHILVSEIEEGGLSLFLKKLNGGYAKYFNERYNRSGTLFESRTKKVLIERDAHFLWILHYIHFNPLDYVLGAKQWRTGHINHTSKALRWLEQYQWSSYQDYAGKENFPEIVQHSFMFNDRKHYHEESKRYLKTIDIGAGSDFILE